MITDQSCKVTKVVNMIFLIRVYQFLIRPILRTIFLSLFGISPSCRFKVSCSEYTAQQIKKDGTISGLNRGLQRFFSCHTGTHELSN